MGLIKPMVLVCTLVATSQQVAAQINDQEQLGNFRNLEGKQTEIQPAGRAVYGMPYARNQHDGQQNDRAQHQRHAVASPELQGDPAGKPQQRKTE